MKILKQLLNARDRDLILGDLAFRRSRLGLWQDNRSVWEPRLFEGFTGGVQITETHSLIKNLLVSRISRVHPVLGADRITAQYCLWDVDSGINPHSDERYRWAATLYLNEGWIPEYGGLFLAGGTSITPEMGTLVINDSHEPHCVSRVKPGAPLRITVQIWAV